MQRDRAMADSSNNENKGEKQEKKFPYLIAARNYNYGEIRSLLELVNEFGKEQIKIKVHETSNARYLDVRTEIESRARFIDYLLQKVRNSQNKLQDLLEENLVDHPFEPPYTDT
jgi:hypothetical protein